MKGFPGIRNVTLIAIALCFAYAVVRYHLFKGVEWMSFPLFISNKAISLAAVVLIALSYWTARLGRDERWPCWLGMLGFGLAGVHSLASLALLDPSYFRKFYDVGALQMNLVGELTMITGVLALACFTCAAVTSIAGIRQAIEFSAWKKWQQVGMIGFYLTLVHVVVMGVEGWIHPGAWPGNMPPISMVATAIILITLVFRWTGKRVKKD